MALHDEEFKSASDLADCLQSLLVRSDRGENVVAAMDECYAELEEAQCRTMTDALALLSTSGVFYARAIGLAADGNADCIVLNRAAGELMKRARAFIISEHPEAKPAVSTIRN
jgi:hypothetical protein